MRHRAAKRQNVGQQGAAAAAGNAQSTKKPAQGAKQANSKKPAAQKQKAKPAEVAVQQKTTQLGLGLFLKSAHLGQYTSKLAELGAVEVDDLSVLLTDSSVDVGMKPLELARLKRHLELASAARPDPKTSAAVAAPKVSPFKPRACIGRLDVPHRASAQNGPE